MDGQEHLVPESSVVIRVLFQSTFQHEDPAFASSELGVVELRKLEVDLPEVPIAKHVLDEDCESEHHVRGTISRLQFGCTYVGPTVLEVRPVGIDEADRFLATSPHDQELRQYSLPEDLGPVFRAGSCAAVAPTVPHLWRKLGRLQEPIVQRGDGPQPNMLAGARCFPESGVSVDLRDVLDEVRRRWLARFVVANSARGVHVTGLGHFETNSQAPRPDGFDSKRAQNPVVSPTKSYGPLV